MAPSFRTRPSDTSDIDSVTKRDVVQPDVADRVVGHTVSAVGTPGGSATMSMLETDVHEPERRYQPHDAQHSPVVLIN